MSAAQIVAQEEHITEILQRVQRIPVCTRRNRVYSLESTVNVLVRLSLFGILSRLVVKINDLHFWKNNVYLRRHHGITIRVIFLYAVPLAGTKTPSVLNASSTNCYCERVFASSAKL